MLILVLYICIYIDSKQNGNNEFYGNNQLRAHSMAN